MPKPPDLDASPLRQRACTDFFLQDRLFPILARQDGGLKNVELVEAFLWLHHGVEIDYFALADARAITYEHFPVFLRAWGAVRSSETWFTRPLRATVDNEFSGRRPLFEKTGVFDNLTLRDEFRQVNAAFQSVFILANGFAQNAKARPLVEALIRVNDITWENVIRNNELVVSVERPAFEPLRDVGVPNWTHSGVFATVDFMQAFRAINLNLGQCFPFMRDAPEFLRTWKETQQWRLNFGYPRERTRFLQVGRVAADAYAGQFGREANLERDLVVADFMRMIADLMTDWGAPLSRAAGA